ncbi:MAG: FAD-dependent oxidoreductase, partial [Oscillospiraceae bacterium]
CIYPEIMPNAEKSKKIAIIGAGPAGVTLAVNAAKRGHKVEIFEASDKVGGKIIAGGVPKIKFDLANYREFLQNDLNTAIDKYDVKVNFKTIADNEMLKSKNFDTVVFANGTRESIPPINGIDRVKHVLATELLNEPTLLGDAKNVVVVGGGVVGCETAYWLTYEKKCSVKVVEMSNEIMEGVCTANRGHLIHYLELAGTQLINGAKVTGFEENNVIISKNSSKNLPNPYNTWQPILPKNIENPLAPKIGTATETMELKCDMVVLAMGGKSDNSLFFDAQQMHIANEIYNIGDSNNAGRVLEATRAAYALANSL